MNNNMLTMSCDQGYTPLLLSNNFVNISEFVMVNELQGIPVEMNTLRRACDIHALLKISARHNVYF